MKSKFNSVTLRNSICVNFTFPTKYETNYVQGKAVQTFVITDFLSNIRKSLLTLSAVPDKYRKRRPVFSKKATVTFD